MRLVFSIAVLQWRDRMYPRLMTLAYGLLALLLTTPMTACVTDTPAPSACEVGDTRQADDGCNTCECIEGGEWACTEEACPSPACGADAGMGCEPILRPCGCDWTCGDPADIDPNPPLCDIDCTGMVGEPPVCECQGGQCAEVHAPECTPGEQRLADDGCNQCVCGEDGEWACDEAVCPERQCGGEQGTECVAFIPPCACNYVCGDPNAIEPIEGECDLVCPAIPQPPLACECLDGECAEVVMPECAPGAERLADDGCNTCRCGPDGRWSCTELPCPEPQCGEEGGFECAAIFDTCNCAWSCGDPNLDQGLVACDVDCGEIEEAPPVCDCVDGECVAVPTRECAPGEVRPADDGCNTCECDDEGQWACTELACPGTQCGEDSDQACAPIFLQCECRYVCGDPSTLDPDAPQCLIECPQVEYEPLACECVDGTCTVVDDPECVPGDTRASEDGQSCECDTDGRWNCLCEGPSPGEGCMCLGAGPWACP